MKKRILIIMCVLCMCVTSLQCDYVEAKANALDVKRISKREAMTDILVGGGIATETALGWVLNALGFTAASKAVYDSRDNLIYWVDAIRDDMLQVAKERYKDLQVDAVSLEQWLQQVANGTLDKSSDCWRALKRYLTEAKSGSVSAQEKYETIEADGIVDFIEKEVKNRLSDVDNTNVYKQAADCSYVVKRTFDFVESNAFLDENGEKYEKHENSTIDLYAPKVVTQDKDNVVYAIVKFVFTRADGSYDICTVAVNPTYSDDNKLPFLTDIRDYEMRFSLGKFKQLEYAGTVYFTDHGVLYPYAGVAGATVMINKSIDILGDYANVLLPLIGCGLVNGYEDWDVKVKNPTKIGGVAKEVADSIAVAPGTQEILDRDKTLDNVDVVSGMDIPVDGAIPTDLTGVKVGDLAIPYTDAVPNVDTVDVVKDVTLPDKIPTKEKTKTKPKKRTGEFTLSGLQEVFPFCVPWDLKALGSTLVADAKAPKFTVKLPSGMNKKGVVYTEVVVDLKQFDDVAKILRVMELLLFCIGLVFVTRYLIKG